jgi:hypothetical protein
MKERPILFNGDMVRAILDGRKTQTRRLVGHSTADMLRLREEYPHKDYNIGCPLGQVGDRLWVRETFMDLTGTGIESRTGKRDGYAYRADTSPGSYSDETRKEHKLKWTPSIHMPRTACRIVLEITGVRVERLQDITEEDAKAEGAAPSTHAITPQEAVYRVGFLNLWCSLYGEKSWQANPWCWVIEFKLVEKTQ